MLIQPVTVPGIFRMLAWKELIWELPSDRQEILLTFDDGPSPFLTREILAILEAYDAQASFFCVGDNIRKYPRITEEIAGKGHAIGNHTFSHRNGWQTSLDEYLADVAACDIHAGSRLFRPPYGRLRREQARLLARDHDIILWSVMSWDFHPRTSREQCLHNVLHYTESGSVVVFHDHDKAKDKMLFSLPRFLEHFSRQGYTFAAITEEKVRECRKGTLADA